MSTWTTYDGRTLDVSDLKVMIGKPGWDDATERTALALLVRAILLAATCDELWDLARILVWGAQDADGQAVQLPSLEPNDPMANLHPHIRAGYAWLDRRVAELSAEEPPITTEASASAFERLTRATVTGDQLDASPAPWKGRFWVCIKSHESVDYREARLAEVMTPGMFAFWREDPPVGARNLSGTLVRDISGSAWYIYGQEQIVRGPLERVATLKLMQSLWCDDQAQPMLPGLFGEPTPAAALADQPQLLLSFA